MKELSEIGITEMMLRELGVEIVDEIPQPRPDEETIAICISAQEYIFADNVFTVCAECGGGIQHRPDLPAFIKKVCLKCAAKPNDSQSNSSAK
jgi:hypothetical protein